MRGAANPRRYGHPDMAGAGSGKYGHPDIEVADPRTYEHPDIEFADSRTNEHPDIGSVDPWTYGHADVRMSGHPLADSRAYERLDTESADAGSYEHPDLQRGVGPADVRTSGHSATLWAGGPLGALHQDPRSAHLGPVVAETAECRDTRHHFVRTRPRTRRQDESGSLMIPHGSSALVPALGDPEFTAIRNPKAPEANLVDRGNDSTTV